MALRDQPYLPLYVDDVLVDEKLRECSAESVGVYFFLLCFMHKSEEYGTIVLPRQNDRQNLSTCLDFAEKLTKHFPWNVEVIERALKELLAQKVIRLEGDKISQKRMVKDNYISQVRSQAGKKGSEKTNFAKGFADTKRPANSVNGNVIVNDINNKKKRGVGERKKFIPPTLEEVQAYCQSRGNHVNAKKFWEHYDVAGWVDTKGNPVRNWKQKMISVWEKDEPQDKQPEKKAQKDWEQLPWPEGMRPISPYHARCLFSERRLQYKAFYAEHGIDIEYAQEEK